MTTLRVCKCLLVCAMAFFYLLVVFNNLTDYESNYAFVHHVLLMDSTFPGNHGMWRAVPSPLFHHIFYDLLIAWECVTTALLVAGAVKLFLNLKSPVGTFTKSKDVAIAALTLSLLMWLSAFLSVGAEWFLMWQSKTWNGQEAAGRMFMVVGIVLLLVAQPEQGSAHDANGRERGDLP